MNTFPSIPEFASLMVAWLVTYLLHSTLLLGAAWGATRQLAGRAPAVADVIWKTALVGGLVTASLQVGWGALAPRPAPAPALSTAWLEPVDPAAVPQGVSPGAFAAPHPVLSTLSAQLSGWQRLLLTVWGAGAFVGAIFLLAAWRRLQRHLANRRLVAEGPARRCLDELAASLGEPNTLARRVRLTGSAELPVPVALGVLQPEICLPERALAELPEAERRGLLAHELGHVMRRDPLWLLFAHTAERLFFLQPLHRLARQRLQETSELLADAWALRATGDRHGLARCLVEVAGWLRSPQVGLPAPGMAGPSGAHLQSRVARILAAAGDGAPRWRAVTLGLAAAVLVAVVFFVPGLAPLPLGATPAPERVGESAPEPVAGAPVAAERVPPADEERAAENRTRRASSQDRRRILSGTLEAESERIAALARELAEQALAQRGQNAEGESTHSAVVEALAAARRELQRALELQRGGYLAAAEEARELWRVDLEAAAEAHREQYEEAREQVEAELTRARAATDEQLREALRAAQEGQHDALEIEREALQEARQALDEVRKRQPEAHQSEIQREREALRRRLSEIDRAQEQKRLERRERARELERVRSRHAEPPPAGEPSCSECPAAEEEGDPPG